MFLGNKLSIYQWKKTFQGPSGNRFRPFFKRSGKTFYGPEFRIKRGLNPPFTREQIGGMRTFGFRGSKKPRTFQTKWITRLGGVRRREYGSSIDFSSQGNETVRGLPQ